MSCGTKNEKVVNVFTVGPSLAGTGKDYVLGQIREKDGGVKIQIAGPNVNRDYGYTDEVSCCDSFLAFLNEQDAFLPSLAGNSSELYTPARFKFLEGNRVHIQVAGSNGNRDYGYATDLDLDESFTVAVETKPEPPVVVPFSREMQRAFLNTELINELPDLTLYFGYATEVETHESLKGTGGVVIFIPYVSKFGILNNNH